MEKILGRNYKLYNYNLHRNVCIYGEFQFRHTEKLYIIKL